MKKTLTYLLVVVALVALASTASAITCTIDQHPAATLLVPYFQVTLNADGSVNTSSTGSNTLITVVNASSQATLAHVVVWNRRSVPLLDFNIALTAFDIVNFDMAGVLTGVLPSTPGEGTADSGLSGSDFAGKDVCQRNASAKVYPNFDGFLRFRPTTAANGQDNSQATTQYSAQAFGSDFAALLADALDYDSSEDCPDVNSDSGDLDITGSSTPGNGNLSGYVTIDMINYCTLSNPSVGAYWNDDAAGWENNLWGDYIIVSNSGLPTLGASTVQIEAALDTVAVFTLDGVAFHPLFQQPFNGATYSSEGSDVVRTFYARYWEDPIGGNSTDQGAINNGGVAFPGEGAYMAAVFPGVSATYGDEREPLGLRYGVRYLLNSDDTPGADSAFRVWRGSAGSLTDLTGDHCSDTEVNVLATIYDTDENTTTISGCPSPCPQTHVNFPYETQRVDAGDIVSSTGFTAGWVYINFLGNEAAAADGSQNLDQAWIDYELSAGLAFINSSVPGVQLDPSTCFPEGINVLFDNNELDPTISIEAGLYPWPVGLGHP